MEQDTVEPALESARLALLASSLLNHKDRGVKILTACCSADMMRLYAPDCPYSAQQLKTLFALFFKLLPGLGNFSYCTLTP